MDFYLYIDSYFVHAYLQPCHVVQGSLSAWIFIIYHFPPDWQIILISQHGSWQAQERSTSHSALVLFWFCICFSNCLRLKVDSLVVVGMLIIIEIPVVRG